MTFSLVSAAVESNPHIPASLRWRIWMLLGSAVLALFCLFLLLAYFSLSLWSCRGSSRERKEGGALKEGSRGSSDCKYEELSKALPFPGNEDKWARFQRWARCLRRQPAPARPPLPAFHVDKDSNVHVAIEAFTKGREWTANRGWGSLKSSRGAASSFVSDQEEGGEGAQGSPAAHQGGSGYSPEVRERMLQFLLKAGPPKCLCAITEADYEGSSTPGTSPAPSTPLTPNHAPNPFSPSPSFPSSPCLEPLLGGSTPGELSEHLGCTERAQRRGGSSNSNSSSSRRTPEPMEMDGEVVLKVWRGQGQGPVTVTREALWAALAVVSRGSGTAQRQGQGEGEAKEYSYV